MAARLLLLSAALCLLLASTPLNVAAAAQNSTQNNNNGQFFLDTFVNTTVPTVCYDSFDLCLQVPTHAKTFIDTGDYCGFLYDRDAKLCLVNGGSCTDADLQQVQRKASCPQNVTVPASPSPSAMTSSGSGSLYGLATTADANITAFPNNIHNGFTKYLTINCTFLSGPGSDFHSIMSLILSKTSTPKDSVYEELATVTVYSNDTVDVIDDLGADVSSHLAARSESFITYQWKYPDQRAEGNYKCVGFGMDMRGHPRVSEAVTTVADKAVDLDMVLAKMSNMDREIDEVLRYKEQVGSRFDNSKSALVEATLSKGGAGGEKPYFLSRPVTRNVWVDDSLCRMHGGRLVEVDDKAEDGQVMTLAAMAPKSSQDLPVALGSTDIKTEGTWTFLKSGMLMTYFDWQPGHTNAGTSKNCLYIGKPEAGTTKAPMTTTTTMRTTTTTTKARPAKTSPVPAPGPVTKTARVAPKHRSRRAAAAIPGSAYMFDDTCYELSFDRFVCEY